LRCDHGAGDHLSDGVAVNSRPSALSGLAFAAASGLVVIDAYLVLLLAAATRARPGGTPASPVPQDPTRILVVVPAHDEAAGIGACLRALARSHYPQDAYRVLVVADNCTDATAALAREAGVEVLERDDPAARGKGHALNWALDRTGELGFPHDAVAFVDADCEVSENLLAEAAARLGAGAGAVQAAYVVSNPNASPATALRAAAFSLFNYVRPLGRSALGMSAGVLGTGMAFRAPLIQAFRFDTASVIEDTDLHLRFVEAGHRVEFSPLAEVRSPMPGSAGAVATQQARWEGGRTQLIRRFLAPLALDGLRHGRRPKLGAAADLLIPPLSILALAHAAVLVASVPLGRSRGPALAAQALLATFVVGGLRLARAPRSAYRALAGAPLLVGRKVALYAGMAVRGGPTAWERTEREPEAEVSPVGAGRG
jgi:hypothetical protein